MLDLGPTIHRWIDGQWVRWLPETFTGPVLYECPVCKALTLDLDGHAASAHNPTDDEGDA